MEKELLNDLSQMIMQFSDSIRREEWATASYQAQLLESLSRLKRQAEAGALGKITPEQAEQLKSLLRGLQTSHLTHSDLWGIDRQLNGLSDVMARPDIVA
jgi:hypothetical protein